MKSTYQVEKITVVEGRAEGKLNGRRRAIDDSFLDRTIQLFQPRMNRPLSREDARQIVENMTGFFQTLAEWERAERAGINDRTGPKSNIVDSGNKTAHSDS